METIQQLIKEDLAILDQVITTDLKSNIFLIGQVSQHIISSGGKRLRPLLCLLCGRIAGFTNGTILHKMAAMIEYIHTATLLHDDVVDESGLRRGRKTANSIFGNSASILVGDFIYTRAFQLMVESGSLEILKIMANSTNKISEGEVLQLLNIGRNDLTETEYFEVIKCKTATLFAAAANVAAIVAKSTQQFTNHLVDYATNLGYAFQITDDLLDYCGNSSIMGKNIGDDLIEGKVTLPLIYLLKHGKKSDQELIRQAISYPQQVDIEYLVEIVKNSEASAYCLKTAQKFITRSHQSLAVFPESKYKTALYELANIASSRIK